MSRAGGLDGKPQCLVASGIAQQSRYRGCSWKCSWTPPCSNYVGPRAAGRLLAELENPASHFGPRTQLKVCVQSWHAESISLHGAPMTRDLMVAAKIEAFNDVLRQDGSDRGRFYFIGDSPLCRPSGTSTPSLSERLPLRSLQAFAGHPKLRPRLWLLRIGIGNFWCCCAAAASLAFTGTRTVCPAASRRRRGLQNRRARSQRAVKAATLPPRGLVYHPSCTHARMLARPESPNNPLKYSQTPFKPTQEPEP